LLLQNIGMGIGVLALYILARYQDSISFGWRIKLCQDSCSQNIFLKLVYWCVCLHVKILFWLV
jgi:hypothetical protein